MLDGPRVPPARGPADSLVVLLHGYGADGNDLISLGEAWADLLPDAEFVSPHAPRPCAAVPFGREWFPLGTRPSGRANDLMSGLREGVTEAVALVDAFASAELARLGLGNDALAFVGFSQGAALALQAGLGRPARAIVAYSGALGLIPAPLPEPKPRVLLAHGDQDAVVPFAAMGAAEKALVSAGVAVRTHVARGVGHGIDPESLAQGGRFLREAFAQAQPAPPTIPSPV